MTSVCYGFKSCIDPSRPGVVKERGVCGETSHGSGMMCLDVAISDLDQSHLNSIISVKYGRTSYLMSQ